MSDLTLTWAQVHACLAPKYGKRAFDALDDLLCATIDEAAYEVVRLRAVLDSIDARHWRKTEFPECGNDEWCGGCGWPWPFPDHLLLHPAPKEANRG
jgi:hypothetical protein